MEDYVIRTYGSHYCKSGRVSMRLENPSDDFITRYIARTNGKRVVYDKYDIAPHSRIDVDWNTEQAESIVVTDGVMNTVNADELVRDLDLFLVSMP